jgi:hypothetical protein
MPKHDGTGPSGNGPMTGRGSGNCIIPLNTAEQELEFLKNREMALRTQLKQVDNRKRLIEQKEDKKEVLQ